MHIWPQVTWLAIMVMGAGISLAKYGEQKRDRYDLGDLVIAPAITLTILYYGGFFTPLGFAP